MITQPSFMQANKALPELPKISVETRRYDAQDNEESCPSPIVRKYNEGAPPVAQQSRTRVPQLKQSRRWARRYGSARLPPTPPPKSDQLVISRQAPETKDRILTKREESFEQQRAELKRFPVTLANINERERGRNVSDSSSPIQESTLCRPVASQYWKTVKASMSMGPRTKVSRKHDIRPQSRRATPTRGREKSRRRHADRVPIPPMARFGIGVPQRRPFGMSEKYPPSTTMATEFKQVQSASNTATEVQNCPRTPGSPVPSLHDPEKDSRFSKECMDILNSMDFNRDWLLTPPSVVLGAHRPGQGVRQASHQIPQADLDERISIRVALASEPVSPYPNSPTLVPAIMMNPSVSTNTPDRNLQGQAPDSGQNERLMVRSMPSTKPSSQPKGIIDILSVSRAVADQSNSRRWTSLTRDPVLRMPSTASSMGRSFRSPGSRMSTDTLAKIEAQVQSFPATQTDEGLSGAEYHRLSEPKPGGAPSIPPERPLPALPAEASMEVHRRSSESSRSRRKLNDGPRPMSSISTIRIVGFTSPEDFVPPALPKEAVEDRVQDSGKNKNEMEVSSVASLRSGGSQRSIRSSRSFTRHSISGLRAERVKERRLRDLAISKPSQSEPERANNAALAETSTSPHLDTEPASQTLNTHSSIDQLDQFPSVPESRPASLIGPSNSLGHARGHSQPKQHLHARQLSKASSTQYRTARPPQKLSQSNIFIVVDSDPVSTRFRAGAMSPAPSIGGSIHSRSGSPYQARKHARAPSTLRETSAAQGSPLKTITKRVSLHSLKSHVSASAISSLGSGAKTKKSARTASKTFSSSSDESHLLLAAAGGSPSKKTAGRAKRRRRWNSIDISHVQTLEQALEYYRSTIMKQEERLRSQSDQIQMMIRVIAPMNRVRGVKEPSGLAAIVDYSTTEETDRRRRPSMAKRPGAVRAVKLPKMGGGPSVNTPKDKSRLVRGHSRHPSTDANSTASATASAHTTDGTKVSADDASMTDPFEYDVHLDVGVNKPCEEMSSTVVTPSLPLISIGPKTTSRPTTRDKLIDRKGGVALTTAVPLHHPPPVAKVTPRGKLPEEMSLLTVSTASTHESRNIPYPRKPMHTLSKDSGLKYRSLNQIAARSRLRNEGATVHIHEDDGSDDDAFKPMEESERDVVRLSVNHVLTSTDQMDRAIEQFMYLR